MDEMTGLQAYEHYDLNKGQMVIRYDADTSKMESSYFHSGSREKITRQLVTDGHLTREGVRICWALCSDGAVQGTTVLNFADAFAHYLRVHKGISYGEAECLFRRADTAKELSVVLELLARLVV